MSKIIKIKGCYYMCPFFGVSEDGMECRHPYFKDKKPYENMIISQDNSKNGKIPEKCPFRKNDLTISITYSLKKINYERTRNIN